MEFITRYIGNIPVYIYQTKKIKTVNISLEYIMDFKKEHYYNVISLGDYFPTGSIKYNTKQKYANAISKLYSPQIYYSEDINRYFHIISMRDTYINGKYLSSKNHDKRNIEMFKDVFFEVNHQYKEFPYTKKRIINSLKNFKNNGVSYSEIKACEISDRFYPYNITYEEKIKLINDFSLESVKEFYDYMLKKAYKMLFIIGDVSLDIIDYFSFLPEYINNNDSINISDLNRYVDEYKFEGILENKENNDYSETRLCLSYHYEFSKITLKNMIIRSFFSYIFVNSNNSYLFKALRTDNSICYNVSGYYVNNFFYISLGINENNYEITRKIIEEELKKFINDDISDELIKQAKEYSFSDYSTIDDSPLRYRSQFMNHTIYEYDFDFKDYINNCLRFIKEITKEDLKEFAKTLVLDNVFFLVGGSDDE